MILTHSSESRRLKVASSITFFVFL